MKLEKMAIANASALSTAILWTICTAGVVLFPSLVESMRDWIMHSSVTAGTLHVTMASYLLGGATLVVVSWIWGYVFGWAWEYVSKK